MYNIMSAHGDIIRVDTNVHWMIGFAIKSKFECTYLGQFSLNWRGKTGLYFTIFKYGVVISIKTGEENIMASPAHAKISVGSAVLIVTISIWIECKV